MSQHDDDLPESSPSDPQRRRLLGGLAAAGAALGLGGEAAAKTAGTAAAASAKAGGRAATPVTDAQLREQVQTIVVLYAENRSFNNLFADFPGLQQPLKALDPAKAVQKDRDGTPLKTLPPIWDGMVPDAQVVNHRSYQIKQEDITGLPNAPFALRTPAGEPLPHGVVTRDLVHEFYRNQMQINGGKNDGFVAWATPARC